MPYFEQFLHFSAGLARAARLETIIEDNLAAAAVDQVGAVRNWLVVRRARLRTVAAPW